LKYASSTDVGNDFINIFAEKFGQIIGVFAQTTASFSKNMIITFFRPKMLKIAPKHRPQVTGGATAEGQPGPDHRHRQAGGQAGHGEQGQKG
jgi:hypothetical protein